MRRIAGSAALVALAVATAGCPGDGELAKAALTERIAHVCGRDRDAVRALERPGLVRGGAGRRLAASVRYGQAYERIARRTLADLRELGRSETDQARFDELLAAEERRIGTLRRLQRAAGAAEAIRTLELLAQLRRREAAIRRTAAALGIRSCT